MTVGVFRCSEKKKKKHFPTFNYSVHNTLLYGEKINMYFVVTYLYMIIVGSVFNFVDMSKILCCCLKICEVAAKF